MKTLIVVESPTKAKTIKQYLGKDYEVVASFGHIRQLPSKNNSVLPDKDFEMIYEYIDKSKKHIDEIVKKAKTVDKVLIASDPDREGEAIAEAVFDLLLKKKASKVDNIKRITYNEVTKNAILEAVNNPRDLDNNLTEAQKARLALDYLFGFTLSPVLWKKLPGSKSAGRVQSVALRMIVERELEILKFKPKEYWSMNVDCLFKGDKYNVKIVSFNKDKFNQDFPNKEQLDFIQSQIEEVNKFEVLSNEVKELKQSPYPPFITSTLQQDASRKLGFSAKKTMQIAQKLYEGIDIKDKTVGLITYMRTDGFFISKNVISDIRSFIDNEFGKDYLPSKEIEYKKKVKSAQEAHEAIRPTDISLTPEKLKNFLDNDMLNLYDLIWKRTVASQMVKAIKERITVELELRNDKNLICGRISETTLKFDGYLKVYNYKEADDDTLDLKLSSLKVGDVLNVKKVSSEQHFTAHPPRFNEASLIANLEELGIGRPSTYASIISVLQERNYVSLERKVFYPKALGFEVALFLSEYFPKYVEYNFTAKLEEDLDLIANGENGRINFLKFFWKAFDENVKNSLEIKIDEVLSFFNKNLNFLIEDILKTNSCSLCTKGKMKFSIGKFGLFLSCDQYPACRNIINFEDLIEFNKGKKDNGEAAEDASKFLASKNSTEGFEVEDGVLSFKTGKFGPYIEKIFKDGTKKNFSIPKNVPFNKTKEEMVFYSSLPKKIGLFEDETIEFSIGKFGPYLKYKNKYFSVKSKNFLDLNLKDAIEIIESGLKNKKT